MTRPIRERADVVLTGEEMIGIIGDWRQTSASWVETRPDRLRHGGLL